MEPYEQRKADMRFCWAFLFTLVVPMATLAQELVASSNFKANVIKPSLELIFRDLAGGYELSALPADKFVLSQDLDKAKGSGDRGTVRISCENSIALRIQGNDEDNGAIQVGICDRDREVTPAMIKAAEDAQRKTMEALSQFDPTGKAFLSYLPQGTSVGKANYPGRYFAAILVSHGVFFFPIEFIELADSRRTVVLQLYKTDCHVKLQSPLCNHQEELLNRLSAAVVDSVVTTTRH